MTSFWLNCCRAEKTTSGICWGCLSCDGPRGSFGNDFSRGWGSRTVLEDAGAGMRKGGLACTLLRFDGHPLPHSPRNPGAEPFVRDAVAAVHLYNPAQREERFAGPFVSRPLQGDPSGSGGWDIFSDRERLYSPESGESGFGEGTTSELPLEQFPGVGGSAAKKAPVVVRQLGSGSGRPGERTMGATRRS